MDELINEVARFVRVKSESGTAEVKALIDSAIEDMRMKGVGGDLEDPLIRQAVRLYCKGYYGYDDNTERFTWAYEALVNGMYLSGDYFVPKEG